MKYGAICTIVCSLTRGVATRRNATTFRVTTDEKFRVEGDFGWFKSPGINSLSVSSARIHRDAAAVMAFDKKLRPGDKRFANESLDLVTFLSQIYFQRYLYSFAVHVSAPSAVFRLFSPTCTSNTPPRHWVTFASIPSYQSQPSRTDRSKCEHVIIHRIKRRGAKIFSSQTTSGADIPITTIADFGTDKNSDSSAAKLEVMIAMTSVALTGEKNTQFKTLI